jgi:hypothetical protein
MASRQLIVCCDGTNNNLTGRLTDTNVTKLCELLDPDGRNQLLYYDPGVGNPGQLPGATWVDQLRRQAERLSGLAFGQGVYENIAEGYAFLMEHYRAGDQVFLFGFSRGAFTARSIGGLVTQFGLLRPEARALIPTLLHTYFADRRENKHYKDVTEQVSALFCSDRSRQASVWFVGVWDTVASVGFPLLGQQTITAKPSIVGKRIHHVRQALALDEHRRAFEPRRYIVDPSCDYAAQGQSIAQVWFPGSHADVGGGYAPDESGLSNASLTWMLQEAVACGLRLRAELHSPSGGLETQALGARLAQCRPTPRGPAPAPPPPAGRSARRVAHAETYETPWWALGGLKLRDATSNPDWTLPHRPITPVEHPAAGQPALRFPGQSAWARRRPRRNLWLALVGLLSCMLLAGWALAPPQLPGSAEPLQLGRWALDTVGQALAANSALTRWQLGWLAALNPGEGAPGAQQHLGWALLIDLPLIVCYAYLLARGTSRAFAQVAGLRHVGSADRPLLNWLGGAAGLAVGADLVENLATWLTWLCSGSGSGSGGVAVAAWVFGLLMTLACAAKWLGLLGSGLLIGWGAWAHAVAARIRA